MPATFPTVFVRPVERLRCGDLVVSWVPRLILKDPEYRELQRAARSRHMSIAEWVRRAIESARRSEPQGSVAKKLGIIRAAVRLEYPTGDIDRMLADIEMGYGSATPTPRKSRLSGKPSSVAQ